MPDSVVQIPFISGKGRFRVDVAGESFYPESFSALCGEKTIEGIKSNVTAQLILQDDNPHDNRAVAVSVAGHQVGHLSRESARAFRRLVRYGAMSVYDTFSCAAMISGGWDRGNGDVGEYGVRLDLDLSDE
jgi:hypothetical protein